MYNNSMGFINPDLMIDLAEDAQAYQDAIDTGPQMPEDEPEPEPAPAPAKAGMDTTTLLIGAAVVYFLFLRK